MSTKKMIEDVGLHRGAAYSIQQLDFVHVADIRAMLHLAFKVGGCTTVQPYA